MVVRTLLTRGLLVGLLAGLVAFGFAEVVGEESVGRAISFQEQLDASRHKPAEASPVSRVVQSTLGLATGTILMSVALGGLFALLFAFVRGRIGPSATRPLAALLAGAALLSVYVVPFLKYPANPPSTGRSDTIGHRSLLYFMMIDISLLFTVGAVSLWRRLRRRFDAWDTSILTGAAYAAVVAISYALMPTVNQVPAGFPASTLWKFRLASLGIQTVMWATIGLLFGSLTERSLRTASVTASGAATGPR